MNELEEILQARWEGVLAVHRLFKEKGWTMCFFTNSIGSIGFNRSAYPQKADEYLREHRN